MRPLSCNRVVWALALASLACAFGACSPGNRTARQGAGDRDAGLSSSGGTGGGQGSVLSFTGGASGAASTTVDAAPFTPAPALPLFDPNPGPAVEMPDASMADRSPTAGNDGRADGAKGAGSGDGAAGPGTCGDVGAACGPNASCCAGLTCSGDGARTCRRSGGPAADAGGDVRRP